MPGIGQRNIIGTERNQYQLYWRRFTQSLLERGKDPRAVFVGGIKSDTTGTHYLARLGREVLSDCPQIGITYEKDIGHRVDQLGGAETKIESRVISYL